MTPTAAPDTRPSITVVLGPAGSGKTSYCLDRYVADHGRAYLAVASTPVAKRLRERVDVARNAETTPKEDRIGTFSELIRQLAGASSPDAAVPRTFQRLAVSELIARHISEDAYFARVREMPGLPGAVCELFRELKLSRVSPAELEHAAQEAAARLEDETFEQKAREIVRLFEQYRRLLDANGLHDEEDLVDTAIDRIDHGKLPTPPIKLVMVDGLSRLWPAWRALLASLGRRGVELAVTLPDDPDRPLLFATPQRTLRALHAEFQVTELRLAPRNSRKPRELAVLERGLFAARPSSDAEAEPGAPHSLAVAAQPVSAPPVVIFDAPNPYAEAEMVAAELRREHDQHGFAWQECAIVARAISDYAPILRGVCWKYEVPLRMSEPNDVVGHPAVKALLTLFDVYLYGWQRQDVIAFLKSSFVRGDKLDAEWLRRTAQRDGVREGRERWQRLADRHRQEERPLASVLAAMLEFGRALTESPRTHEQYEATLRRVIRSLFVELRLRQPEDEDYDEAADAMQQVRSAAEQLTKLAALSQPASLSFAEYHRALVGALSAATYVPARPADAVPVVEPHEASHLSARIVAVMGMVERVFPRRVLEDPFLRDDERVALARAGAVLQPQRDRADDERLLFYTAVTAAGERLILSFPRASTERDTLPSFYLDEVRAAELSRGGGGSADTVPVVYRALAEVAPAPEESVTDHERLLSACAAIGGATPYLEPADPALREILASRHRPPLPRLDETAHRDYATARRYRVTEIETYLRCPFQHLMQYGLGLQVDVEGAGPLDKGALLHAVLRNAMRKRCESGQAAAEQITACEMREMLANELQMCLSERAVDARPHRRQMMVQALTDALDSFAEREKRYAPLFGLTPAHFELAFGQDPADPEPGPEDDETGPENKRSYDQHSMYEPLTIAGVDGQAAVHLCGTLDRVDLSSDGRRAMVLDYKLGGTAEWDHIKQGKSLQIPLYMLAAERVFGWIPAVGAYDSPRDQARRRFYRKGEADLRTFALIPGVEHGTMAKPLSAEEYTGALLTAENRVREAVAGIRAGRVTPTPGDYCRFCSYGDICRVGRDNAHDGEPLALDQGCDQDNAAAGRCR